MVARYCDGFGTYNTSQISRNWDIVSGSPEIEPTGGRADTACARFDDWGYGLTKIFDNQNEWIVGLAIKGLPINESILVTFLNSGAQQCYVTVRPTGAVAAYRGNGNLLGVSNAGIIVLSQYAHIEVYAKVELSGRIIVRVDEVNVLDVNGLTSVSTDDFANRVRLFGGPSHSATVRIDDVIIMDGSGSSNNDLIGSKHVVDTIRPNGVGASEEWFGSGGSNYLRVDDDISDDNTTTVLAFYEATDTYNFEDVDEEDIAFVQIRLVAKRPRECARTIEPVVRVGGVDYEGDDFALEQNYKAYTQAYDVNPDTNDAWTTSEVNSAEFGMHHII